MLQKKHTIGEQRYLIVGSLFFEEVAVRENEREVVLILVSLSNWQHVLFANPLFMSTLPLFLNLAQILEPEFKMALISACNSSL